MAVELLGTRWRRLPRAGTGSGSHPSCGRSGTDSEESGGLRLRDRATFVEETGSRDGPSCIHARRQRERRGPPPRISTDRETGPGYCGSNKSSWRKSVLGLEGFEYEVMRDGADIASRYATWRTSIRWGVHTGESIVVAPAQTLSDSDHQTLGRRPPDHPRPRWKADATSSSPSIRRPASTGSSK